MDQSPPSIPPEALATLPDEKTLAGRLARALLTRYPIWPVLAFLSKKSVPMHRHSAWYAMGGIALLFFVVQLITGILLMVYYRPSQPWQSVQRIVNEVPFGNVIRSVHHWAANLMILTLFVHMFSTFFMKAYRAPREGTWLTGLMLLGLMMIFGFSGYLLPWDDVSFFATRVGISEAEKLPGLGLWLANLARGGTDVTIETIGRFYPLHVVVLPLAVLALISVHLLFVQIQGVSAPDSYHRLPPEKQKSVSFFGEFMISEVPVWLLMGALLAFLATFFPRGLSPEADPTAAAPLGIKPEWYFLSQYQALKLFPGKFEVLGQAVLGVIPMIAFALPFIDRAIPADRRGHRVTWIGLAALVSLVGMTVWGVAVMNYPVWDVPGIGAGLVVAIIAILHVLVSHIAVGGGAFLFIAELWARRQPDQAKILRWLKRYLTFFLVYTTVFGAITGVGIWFSIQLASPEATSLLIHQFVFAWAIEWVAFLGELTVLYLYYYGYDTNSARRQVFLAGAYFFIAWISLVVINGILSFMMTPAGWTLQNHDLVAGFFNPGYLPSLGLRTVVMFVLAGLSAFVIAARIEDDESLKNRVIRFAARFVIPAAVLAPLFTALYYSTLPTQAARLTSEGVVGLAGGKLEILSRALWLSGTAFGLIFIGTAVLVLRPAAVNRAAALALLVTAQLGIAGGEFYREMARKPYVIHGVLYSNSLWKQDATPTTLAQPFLSRAKWHPKPTLLTKEHGAWIFRLQCAACHTRDGYRSVTSRTATFTPSFAYNWPTQMDRTGVMPPFQGNDADRAALAAYLLSLRGVDVEPESILSTARADAVLRDAATHATHPRVTP